MKVRTFLIDKPIDYQKQRASFAAYLQNKEKNVAVGLELYDDLLQFVGQSGETFLKYDFFHHTLKQMWEQLKLRMRLYVVDDGNNALFVLRSIPDADFVMKFYVEFKSIYGDVEKMRIAKIAKRIAKA